MTAPIAIPTTIARSVSCGTLPRYTCWSQCCSDGVRSPIASPIRKRSIVVVGAHDAMRDLTPYPPERLERPVLVRGGLRPGDGAEQRRDTLGIPKPDLRDAR